jgi:hypothetical protein
MRRLLVLNAACAVALAACGDVSSRVTDAADATRSATEHAAATSAARDQARVARIAAEAAPAQQGEAFALGERYVVRPDGEGWTVVDRTTNAPADAGEDKPTEKLNIRDAEKLAGELRAADTSR